MGTEEISKVKGKVSFGEVHDPKVRVASANPPKICSSTMICCNCVGRKNGRSLSSSLTPHFLIIQKLALYTNDINDRVLIINNSVLYTFLTHIEHCQNIIEHFGKKMQF